MRPVLWGLGLLACGAGPEVGDALQHSQRMFRRECLIEGAGLFWIVAELALLFAMLAARRYVEASPNGEFLLTPTERRRALRWSVAFVALAALTFGRHALIAPMPRLLAQTVVNTTVTAAQIAGDYALRAHIHKVLWAGFVTAWVVLEVAIVYQGIRVYGAVKEHLLEREENKAR